VGIIGLYMWRLIPDAREKEEKLAKLDEEIAKYEKFEGTLDQLEEKKELLLSEFTLYSAYPNRALDIVTPFAVLVDTIGENSWVVGLKFKKRSVTINGGIRAESKVEALRQLSALRVNLKKYCKNVKVKGQKDTYNGLIFSLELTDVVDLSKFLETQKSAGLKDEGSEPKQEVQEKAKNEENATGATEA
jgi:hypothetical protein